MKTDSELVERHRELIAHIITQNKYALECEQEENEADAIKKELIKRSLNKLNHEFINTHNWVKMNISSVKEWDIVIYENMVCRITDLIKTSYNEGEDTYNYRAIAVRIFTKEENNFEFGYYDQIKVLK